MLTVKPTTFTSRLLERWNLAITEATNRRDKAALRVLSKILAATVDSLPGAERARALALIARADACLRYLNTWRGWRGERRWRLRHARRVMP